MYILLNGMECVLSQPTLIYRHSKCDNFILVLVLRLLPEFRIRFVYMHPCCLF